MLFYFYKIQIFRAAKVMKFFISQKLMAFFLLKKLKLLKYNL